MQYTRPPGGNQFRHLAFLVPRDAALALGVRLRDLYDLVADGRLRRVRTPTGAAPVSMFPLATVRDFLTREASGWTWEGTTV